jgi:dipeptide transport system permease protein
VGRALARLPAQPRRDHRLAIVVVLLLCALGADVIAPHPPAEQYRERRCARRRWSRSTGSVPARHRPGRPRRAVAADPRHAAVAADRLVSVGLSLSGGVVLGLLAGFFRGGVEFTIMRLMDIMLALPSLLLAVAVVAILGPGLMNAMYAIAIVMLPHFVRLTRAAVIGELAKDYVTASRIAGAGTLRLMFDTVLPNCAAPLIVQATLGFSSAILDAAALGFLGLGAQPPTPEWGSMLASALEFIQSAWWVVTLPGPRDPGLGAGLQPDGRRAARRARSQAEAVAQWPCWRSRTCMSSSAPTPRPSARSTASASRSTAARCWASSANRARARASPRSR